MNEKCNLYEHFFIFRPEEEFYSHIKNCKVCRNKHQEMLKIEGLVRSSKPAYIRSQARRSVLKLNKVAAIFFITMLSLSYSGGVFNNKFVEHPKVLELVNNSLFNTMNLPTDEYGVLDPQKELNYE